MRRGGGEIILPVGMGRQTRLRSRLVLCAVLIALVASSSGAAAKSRHILWINAFANTGSRAVFEGYTGPKAPFYAKGNKEGLWLQKFGSSQLQLLATPASARSGFCVDDEAWETEELALGPQGSVACLTVGGGISEEDFELYVVLGNGSKEHLISRTYEGGAEGEGTPEPDEQWVTSLFGDGTFLGYTEATEGIVKLYRITRSGGTEYVADLAGLSSCGGYTCGPVAVDSGHIVILEGGDLHVFTTTGAPVSTFSANLTTVGPAHVIDCFDCLALRKNRILVLSGAGKLSVYTLGGTPVHSYRVHNGLTEIASYYGYAAYFGRGHKAVHVIKLSSGRDVAIAPVPPWEGDADSNFLSLQAPGLTVVRTGKPSLLYIPMKTIRKKLG
jgi:hypothetical protein